MHPDQTPNNNQNNNPPQGNNPYGHYNQAPQNPQYQQQPYNQTPTQQTGQQYQQQPEWYKAPEPTKQDYAPSKASDYVNRATTPPIQQGQLVNGQYSVDYLSGMSGTSNSKFSKKFIIIAAGALVLTVALAGALLAMTPKQENTPAATLSSVYTIMSDTQEVTKNAGENIKNSKLKGVNSSLDTVLLSTMQSIEAPLESGGNKVSGLRSAAKKAPIHDAELREKLEEARLLVMYDRVYLMQMEFKIEEIMRRIEYVHARIGSEDTKESLQKGHDSLKSIKESIEGFAESEDAGII